MIGTCDMSETSHNDRDWYGMIHMRQARRGQRWYKKSTDGSCSEEPCDNPECGDLVFAEVTPVEVYQTETGPFDCLPQDRDETFMLFEPCTGSYCGEGALGGPSSVTLHNLTVEANEHSAVQGAYFTEDFRLFVDNENHIGVDGLTLFLSNAEGLAACCTINTSVSEERHDHNWVYVP